MHLHMQAICASDLCTVLSGVSIVIHYVNGMPVRSLPRLDWARSGRSGPQGNCVELAQLPGGDAVAVRNSRQPYGPALICSTAEIRVLIDGLKAGDFDDILCPSRGG